MMGLVPALLLLTLDEVIGLDEVDVGVFGFAAAEDEDEELLGINI